MMEINPNSFFDIMWSLYKAENESLQIYEADKEAILSNTHCQKVKGLITVTERLCEVLKMNCQTEIANVRARVEGRVNDSFGKTYLGIYTDIKTLRESIRFFLRDKVFLYKSPHNSLTELQEFNG